MIGDFFGAADVFDVGFQDAVQDCVVGKGVLIFLIRTQLGGGGFD